MELRSPGAAPLLADLVEVEVEVGALLVDPSVLVAPSELESVGLPASVLDAVLDGAPALDEAVVPEAVFPELVEFLALFWN